MLACVRFACHDPSQVQPRTTARPMLELVSVAQDGPGQGFQTAQVEHVKFAAFNRNQ